MKKVMIAAVAAAFAGVASAADCTTDCAWAYKVKTIVKTTVSAGVSNATTCASGCYRKPAYRRYIGYVFGAAAANQGTCGTTCDCIDFDGSALAIWNFDTKAAVTPTLTIRLADRIGLNDTSTCELVFDTVDNDAYVTGASSLTFAGFGTVAKQANGNFAIKYASGFCAGTVPGYCSSCDVVCGAIDPSSCTTADANIWTICDVPTTANVTAAYGKWKLQWDAEMANRIATNRTTADGANSTNFTPAGYQTGVATDVAVAYEDNRN